jgi:GT2 family glycosyltransferase
MAGQGSADSNQDSELAMTDAKQADRSPLTVAIPTYRREQVLIDTLDYLLALQPPPAEILVLDQTEQHEPATIARLQALAEAGAIRWVQLAEPSIPKAMNQGLLLATQELVLFLDDDIRPVPSLLAEHLAKHALHPDILVVGRVIQPWHEGKTFPAEEPFHFACTKGQWVKEFMGGNFSILRATALALGGFDENFVRVAYRFEAEFAYRFRESGRRIYFEPLACIHHLKVAGGGTRAYGKLLTTTKPDHAVGVYYHCLRTGSFREFAWRFMRAATTRHHLRHPWYIPGTLLAELRGMLWAFSLWWQGPKYVSPVAAVKKK